MQIANETVALIHYTLTNDAGEVIDSSTGGQPLAYMHGHGNIIPGLENGLLGHRAGDKLNVDVAPADGYGVRDESLKQQVPKRAFGGANPAPGMQFHAQTGTGQTRSVTVTHVKGDMVSVDGNHPLAGQNLHFAVEVMEVRAPTAEELEHGHVHGPGGHHH